LDSPEQAQHDYVAEVTTFCSGGNSEGIMGSPDDPNMCEYGNIMHL
jgi:hypothetical protein